MMKLIVGLGNPGEEFAGTRHNIGRDILGALRTREGFPEFQQEKRIGGRVSEGKIGNARCALLLADVAMNKSGGVVSAAMRFFKVKPRDLFIIHDDADILFGSGKLSFGKRSAGHKGVESIIRAVKTRDFWRFRIGIGGKRDIPAEKLVLKKWTPAEKRAIARVAKKTLDAIHIALAESPAQAMNRYHTTV